MNPNSLANLRPWTRGGPPEGSRRSRHVETTLKLARKHSTEALLYGISVLRDAGESTRNRLKAMETILALAMPKDPAALERMLAEMSGDRLTEFVIRFVDPVPPVVVEHAPQSEGNGHDPHSHGEGAPEPFTPVFVDPEP